MQYPCMLWHIHERSHLNFLVQVHLLAPIKNITQKWVVFFVSSVWYNVFMSKALYGSTLASLTLLSSLHWYALLQHLYFFYPALDIFMHLFGGFTIGLCAIVAMSFFFQKLQFKVVGALVFLFVLSSGALWEVFELYLNFEFNLENFSLQDTAADLVNDLIGGMVAFYVAYKKQWYV